MADKAIMFLKMGWQEALRQAFKDHQPCARDPGACCCRYMTAAKRIKEIDKLIINGEAIIKEV